MQGAAGNAANIIVVTPGRNEAALAAHFPLRASHPGDRRTKMESGLSGTHETTYQRMFQHPIPNNLPWREVWSMLGAIADASAVDDDNGNIKITRNGQTLVLHRPRGKDMAATNELIRVRHFLEGSEISARRPSMQATHLLVVIDHREARIYSAEFYRSVPQRIVSYDPFGFGRSLHYNQDHSNGQRKRNSFYEAVAKTLYGAEKILLFGAGTGASSAMEQLVLNLKQHHHDLAERVVGSILVDTHHLTDNQILSKAREMFVAR
ncbi:MAG: hypothetical protein H7Z14_11275 [Anaerolineae bacterium]|nr:hypothetical protein [Phycisphaerae bacterium]